MRKALLVCAGLVCTAPAQAAVFHPAHFTLANGMQVVVVENHLAPVVAQMVWVKVGAADDPAGLSGTAHYLEHMMFKGTQALPAGAFSRIIAAQGGEENAFTTHDATAYHVTVASDRLAMVMQMEAERLRGLTFAEAEPELAVVRSERGQRTDNSPSALFHEKMARALFGEHPYGRPVVGSPEDLARLTPEAARAFYQAHYAPENAILVVSGDVTPFDVLRLAAGTFGRLPAVNKPADLALPPLKLPLQKRLDMKDARVTQPSCVQNIAMPAAQKDLRLADALDVLAELLSGGEVGLLHRHFVLGNRGASGIEASYDSTARGTTLFGLAATPSPDHDVRTLERDIQLYLQALAKRGVAASDVAAAKRRMQDSATFARDRLMAPAQILGEALTTGHSLREVENWPERIGAITVADVNAALAALLASPYRISGILEPAGGAP